MMMSQDMDVIKRTKAVVQDLKAEKRSAHSTEDASGWQSAAYGARHSMRVAQRRSNEEYWLMHNFSEDVLEALLLEKGKRARRARARRRSGAVSASDADVVSDRNATRECPDVDRLFDDPESPLTVWDAADENGSSRESPRPPSVPPYEIDSSQLNDESGYDKSYAHAQRSPAQLLPSEIDQGEVQSPVEDFEKGTRLPDQSMVPGGMTLSKPRIRLHRLARLQPQDSVSVCRDDLSLERTGDSAANTKTKVDVDVSKEEQNGAVRDTTHQSPDALDGSRQPAFLAQAQDLVCRPVYSLHTTTETRGQSERPSSSACHLCQ